MNCKVQFTVECREHTAGNERLKKKTQNTILFLKHLSVTSHVCDCNEKMNMRLRASSRWVLKGTFYRGRGTESPLGWTDAEKWVPLRRMWRIIVLRAAAQWRREIEVIKVAVTKPGAVTEERETGIGEQDIYIYLWQAVNSFIWTPAKMKLKFSCLFSSLVHQHTAQEVLAGDRLYMHKVGFVVTLQDWHCADV